MRSDGENSGDDGNGKVGKTASRKPKVYRIGRDK